MIWSCDVQLKIRIVRIQSKLSCSWNRSANAMMNASHTFFFLFTSSAFVSSFTPTEGNCYTFIAKTNTNPPQHNSVVSASTTSHPKLTSPIGSVTDISVSASITTRSWDSDTSSSINQPYLTTTSRPPDIPHSVPRPRPVRSHSNRNNELDSSHIEDHLASSRMQNMWQESGAHATAVSNQSNSLTTLVTNLITSTTDLFSMTNLIKSSKDKVLKTNKAGIDSSDLDNPLMQKQVESILAGPDHGLELVINLEVNEYLPGTSQVGALVMLHSPDDFGISAGEGILVAPECATYIGMKMMRITRLPAPYPEQCIDVWPAGLQRKSMLNASYSQQACIKICLQRTIQTRCNCQSAFLEQVELNDTEFRICDTRKRSMLATIKTYR